MSNTASSLIYHAACADQHYQHCADRGIRYAMAILRNHSDSEEAVQETFFRLHRKSIQSDDLSFRGMFFSTLRNHCIDLLRKRRVRNEVSDNTIVAECTDNQGEALETDELNEAVAKQLGRLPDNQKQALMLRVHGELSYDEIAAVMNATRQQIRTWIFRARRKLEQSLRLSGVIRSNFEGDE